MGQVISLWPWIPAPLAAAYLILVGTKFNNLVSATYLNADAASAPVIGSLYSGAHHEVILSGLPWFSTLLFELATRWLPLHRQIWEAAPYAMALVSVGLISWAMGKLAGRLAALIAAVLMLCVSPQTLSLLFWLNDHSPTWFSIAVLAAILVLFELRRTRTRGWVNGVIVLAAGVTVGANAASDVLLIVGGLVPLFLAATGTWVLRPTRASANAWWWAVGVLIMAGVADALTRFVMHSANVKISGTLVHAQFASPDALSNNFKLWWQSLMVLGDGAFFGQTPGFTSGLQLICAGLVLIAVAAGILHAWRELTRVWANRDVDLSPLAEARCAWCIFWASSAVLLSAAFIFSSNPQDLSSSRYLLGVIYAAAALVPLIPRLRPMPRAAVTTGTVIFALTGLATLARNDASAGANGPFPGLYNQVARIAAANHLSVGYATYWRAAPLTWATRMRLKVYPVQDCQPSTGPTLCWSAGNIITSWYTPRPGARSFLISDPTSPPPVSPQPSFGPPSRVYHIGPMVMYIYDYDLARVMRP